jgi:WD40 repeat protein/uncharacterized caspase-like protein
LGAVGGAILVGGKTALLSEIDNEQTSAVLFDFTSGMVLHSFGAANEYVSATFDGNSIFVSGQLLRADNLAKVGNLREVSGGDIQVVSGDGQLAAFAISGGGLEVDRTRDGKPIFSASDKKIAGLTFCSSNHDIAYIDYDGNVWLSALDGAAKRLFRLRVKDVGVEARSIACSFDGKLIAALDGTTLHVWDETSSQDFVVGQVQPSRMEVLGTSVTGEVLTGGDPDAFVWDVAKQQTVACICNSPGEGSITSASFSSDGTHLVTGDSDGVLKVWSRNASGRWSVNSQVNAHHYSVDGVAIDPRDNLIVSISTNTGEMSLWTMAALEKRWTIANTGVSQLFVLSFSNDGRYILASGRNNGEVDADKDVRYAQGIDVRSGTVVHYNWKYDESFVGSATSPVGNIVARTAIGGWITLLQPENGKLIARVLSEDSGRWSTVEEDGLFDSSEVESLGNMLWEFSDDPLRLLSPEIFMRDYYEPRLLPRLLACHEAQASGVDPAACKKAFKSVRELASLNRIQAEVKIAKVERGGSADEALVTVEVAGKKDATQKNGKFETAAYDLRLFRNGQIVGQWPEPKGHIGGAEDIGQWKSDSLVSGTEHEGKATHVFKVKLADRDRGQPVKFTAYAFNEDRVKSETASDESYKVPDDVAQPKPRAYVIAIGVNAYDNPEWKLGFAVKDALDLSGALGSIEGYEVVSVPLVSGEKDGASLNQATKRDIADALALLGGHQEQRDRLKQAIGPVVDELRQATPDDLVIIGFSGHGWANPRGRFYLLPSDSGKESAITDASLLKFISSDELSQWLKDVDAGEMAMIIDACHSAGTVDKEFKPGPMGDRGLGQLAYDKGMRILAATQADNVALESAELGQGLLTYALVDEGLKDHKAAPDGKGPITIGAWLRYAEQRVPQLYDDIQTGKIHAAKVVTANDASHAKSKEPIVDPDFRDQIAQHAQTPQLFDFYKTTGDAIVGTR